MTNYVSQIEGYQIKDTNAARKTDVIYPSAYCDTAGGTAAKTAICTDWTLTNKTYIHITFKNANTAQSALTLSINGTTAKSIYINNVLSASNNYTISAGSYIIFYDASYGYFLSTDGYLQTGGISLVVPTNAQTPLLIFQRGKFTDNYNDWGMYDAGGYFYIAQRGSGSSGWSDTRLMMTQGYTQINGYVKARGNLDSNASPFAIASGDRLVVADKSNSWYMAETTLEFDGSTTNKFLSQKGTWESASGQTLAHSHTFTNPTVALSSNDSNANGRIKYVEDVSTKQVTTSHTHTWATAPALSVDNSSTGGFKFVQSVTVPDSSNVAGSGHTHNVSVPSPILNVYDASSTGRTPFITSLTSSANNAASASHTHSYTSPTLNGSAVNTGVDYVAGIDGSVFSCSAVVIDSTNHYYKLKIQSVQVASKKMTLEGGSVGNCSGTITAVTSGTQKFMDVGTSGTTSVTTGTPSATLKAATGGTEKYIHLSSGTLNSSNVVVDGAVDSITYKYASATASDGSVGGVV